MIYPTIHLNGTSAESLIEALMQAHKAIREAASALAQSAPHARDYYVQKDYPQSYENARSEHYSRLQKLLDVKEQLEQLAVGIDERKGNA